MTTTGTVLWEDSPQPKIAQLVCDPLTAVSTWDFEGEKVRLRQVTISGINRDVAAGPIEWKVGLYLPMNAPASMKVAGSAIEAASAGQVMVGSVSTVDMKCMVIPANTIIELDCSATSSLDYLLYLTVLYDKVI